MSVNGKRSIALALLLCLVCAGAFALRARGLYWPRLHPDEPVIGAWIEKSAGRAYVRERVYPNGFFVLARPAALIARAAGALRNRGLYFTGAADRVMPARPDGVMLGRWLSALAGALVCVPVFLLAARASGSAWAGLFAAALAGAARYPVEHSHYAETDMGALLALACSLWLLTAASDSPRRRWIYLAALCSGFAAGTKFTLGILLPVVALAALFSPWHGPRPVAGRLGRAGLAGLLFAAGFAAANPAVFLDWPWFWGSMALEQKRVFAETALNLGPLASDHAVKYIHHLNELGAYAGSLGTPWLILAAVGAACLAGRAARRYWPALLAFPAAFMLYWVFAAPWVRSQEFLFFIPSLAALAAIPVALLWRARNAAAVSAAPGGAWAAPGMALLFAVSALASAGQGGWRAAAVFGWRDTRLLAHDWLAARVPLACTLAAESYAEAACCATRHEPVQIRKAEAQGLEFMRGQGADYLLRSASVSGRGLRNPLTGELYPDYARNLGEFMSGSELLRAWAPLPPQAYTTFASPALELYGLKRFKPEVVLALEPGQPALIGNADQNPAGRQTFFPVGRGLGCADCLLVDRFERSIAVGGPAAPRAPVYLVLTTAERPAVVHYRMRGKSGKAALAPHDAAAVPLGRRGWGARPFEVVTLRAEPAEDVVHIPCYARVAFSVSELARMFMDAGREDRLPEYFASEDLERELPPAEAFVLASRLGNESAAGRLAPAAAAARSALAGCAGLKPSEISVNEVNGFYYDEFARARLQEPFDFACVNPAEEERGGGRLSAAVRTFDLEPAENAPDGPGQPIPYRQALTLPALLTRGSCTLAGEVMLRPAGAGAERDMELSVKDSWGVESRLVLQPGEWSGFSVQLRADRAIQPRLEFSSPLPGQVRLKNMELRWSLSNTLASAAADLDLALAWNDMRRGDRTSAAARLASMPSQETPALDAERLAMRFMCAAGLDSESAVAAARGLLAVSPRHYAALAALADADGAARASAKRLEGNLSQPVLFAPWLSLEGFAFNRAEREVRCVFESQRSGAPGLAVCLWIKRRGEWRRKQFQAISPGRILNRGERVELTVRLNDRFDPAAGPDDLALGLETDAEWHPGAINPAGERDAVIPFSRLIARVGAAPAGM